MYKVMTSVLLAIFIGNLPSAFAAGTTNQPQNCVPPSHDRVEKLQDDLADEEAKGDKSNKQRIESLKSRITSAEATYSKQEGTYQECFKNSANADADAKKEENANKRCESAKNDYLAEQKEILKICTDSAGAPSIGRCKEVMEQCQNINEDTDYSLNINSKSEFEYNPKDLQMKAQNCPAYIAGMFKDWESIKKDGPKKIDDLKRDLNKAQVDQQNSMTKLQEDAIRNEEQLKKITSEQQKVTSELQRAVNQISDQYQQASQQLQVQFIKEKEALDRLETAQEEAKVKFDFETGKIGSDCKEKAEKQVRDYLLSGNGNVGGAISLLRNGDYSRILREKMISYECNQPSVIQARLNANRAYDLTLRANQKSIAQLKAQVANQPKLLNGLFEKFKNIKDDQVKAAQDRLMELADQKQTLMAKMSTGAADQMAKMQLAQQNSNDIRERLQREQADYNAAVSDLNAVKGRNWKSIKEPSVEAVQSLGPRFNALENNFCEVKHNDKCSEYKSMVQWQGPEPECNTQKQAVETRSTASTGPAAK